MTTQKRHLLIAMTFAAFVLMGVGGCEKSEGIVSSEQTLTTVTAEVVDMELAHAVKIALAEEAVLVDADIGVAVTNGEVKLTGIVDNQDQHNRALSIAAGVAGVNMVEDKLAVKEQK
jgi:hyperosmotically inducible protein